MASKQKTTYVGKVLVGLKEIRSSDSRIVSWIVAQLINKFCPDEFIQRFNEGTKAFYEGDEEAGNVIREETRKYWEENISNKELWTSDEYIETIKEWMENLPYNYSKKAFALALSYCQSANFFPNIKMTNEEKEKELIKIKIEVDDNKESSGSSEETSSKEESSDSSWN